MDEMNCIFPENVRALIDNPTPLHAKLSLADMEQVKVSEIEIGMQASGYGRADCNTVEDLPEKLQNKIKLHMGKYCARMTPRQTERYMKKKFNIIINLR